MAAAVRRLPTFPARLEEPCDEVAGRAQAGPRYTSYPPATRFHGGFASDEAAAALAGFPDGPVGVYAHIPFCSQLCWYCGCNVTATRDRSRGGAYITVLTRELELVAQRLGRSLPLAELALGGGSPNFLTVRDLARLVDAIATRFVIERDADLGVELDPRDTTAPQIDALARFGFNRVSVGVQDFDPEVQAAIHRVQTAAQTRAVVDRARDQGFRSVNVDLVYGLPGQSTASLARTLDEVTAIAPDRIAVFGYAHVPHRSPHQRLVERKHAVPGLPERVELLRTVLDRLADAGYVRVGLDHFARPGDPLEQAMRAGRLGRNFQGYVVPRAERLIGVGASAISDAGGAYWQNLVDVAAWTEAVEAGRLPVARGVALDDDDRLRRDVIMRLMCDGAVELGADAAYFEPELARLERELSDLATVDRATGTVTATPLGHHLIRNVCVVFDRDGATAGGSPTI